MVCLSHATVVRRRVWHQCDKTYSTTLYHNSLTTNKIHWLSLTKLIPWLSRWLGTLCFLRKKWVALKRAGCWVALKRNGCWMVWKMVSQTSQLGAVRNDHHLPALNTSFESCLPLVNGVVHHALLELTPCLNQLMSRNSSFLHFTRYAVTFLRWSGQIYSQLVSSFLRSLCT